MAVLAWIRKRLHALSADQWSTLLVVGSFILGTVTLALSYIYGGAFLQVHGQDSVQSLLAHAADGPFASVWVMLVFSGLAIAGVPQFMLIAATVAVFGPWLGGLYAWTATLASAVFGFALGKLFAARMMRRYGGERLNQLGTLIARHGIVSTALIRNVPSAPFIVINVAAGATSLGTTKFLIGTGLGIIPKIGIIMLIGAGVWDALTHWRPIDALWIALVLLAWIAIGFGAKWAWDRLRKADRPGSTKQR